jgi:hypothetical protein
MDEMQLLAAEPQERDEIGRFQDREMFGDGLARHAQDQLELGHGLAVPHLQKVQQPPGARLGQSAENGVIVVVHLKKATMRLRLYRQPMSCVSSLVSTIRGETWRGRLWRPYAAVD